MKSKISFFNKTIYFKNITLYWPIWGLYLLCLLLSGPAMLWLCLREEAINPSMNQAAAQLELICSFADLTWVLITSIIIAILTAMALFNYLSVSKNANMIHAFPVTRLELFGTNLLSGITFLFVPQLITFMINVFVCLAYGASGVEYLAMWLLVSMGVSFFFFSVAVFCTFLTGQMFAAPLYYVAIIFLYDIIRIAVGMVVDFIGYGISFYTMLEYMDATWLAPAHYLWNVLCMEPVYTEVAVRGDVDFYEYCSGLVLHGGKAVALYLIPAVILLVVSYFLYKKRHIENAGDLITVPWLKPIVRWGIGAFSGYFLGVALCSILEEFYLEVSKVGLFFAVIIVSAIFFFITDMCIQKSFKVFQKKRFLELGGFAAFMLVTFLGINLSINTVERYIPEKGDIESISIDMNYWMNLEEDEMDLVLALHQNIVDHLGEYKNIDWMSYDGASYWMNITYYLKNGDLVDRDYQIPENETTKILFEKLQEYEKSPEHYLDYTFGSPYEESVIVDGYLEYYLEQNDGYSSYYDCKELTQSEAQKLYEAAVQDILSGAVQKYNYYSDAYFEEYYIINYGGSVEAYSEEYYAQYEKYQEEINKDTYELWLNLSMYNESEAKRNSYHGWNEYLSEGVSTNTAYLTIGKDCTNLIQALIDIGFIESEEDLENYKN